MKKNTKSKIVLFSVIGLSAISIGTVGFATWVTGIDKKTETVNTSITVDTASNKTCYVEAELGTDNSISLTENTPAENSLITIEGTPAATDLEITFTKLKVIVSSETYTFNSLDFSLEAADAESRPIVGCTYETNGVAPEKLYDEVSNTDKKSYFDIEKKSYTESNGLSKVTADDDANYVEGYDTYVATNLVFTFKWGTLFGGNQSPSQYYKKTGNVTEDLKTSATATKVLNHMNACLKGNSVKLKITANVEVKSA